MIYTASILTPANTLEANAKQTEIKITNGVITQVMILFPTGTAGLVNVQFFMGGHQFVPSTEGQVIKADGVLITSPEFIEVNDAPRIITVKTWNLDDTYDHTIEVLITQLEKQAIPTLALAEGIVKSLKNLFLRERNKKLEEN